MGGKTGTAETIDPITHKRSETEYVVSFIGCVPADDPEIAIYVVVDRVNEEKQDVARYSSEIARSILMEALPYLNIYMTEELSEEEIKELNALQLEITNQYTQTPEGDGNTPEGDGTEPGEGGNTEPSGTGGNGDPSGTGGGTEPDQPWKNYPIDPETGYRVDPDTGRKYDAETGLPIDSAESVPDPNIPVNPNIT